MDKKLEIEFSEIRPKVLSTVRKFFRASRLEGDPEDVVQEVLLRLWEARRKGAQILNAESWAVTTAKNCCISLWRKKGRSGSNILPEWLPDGSDASMRIERSQAESLARRSFEQLSAGTRRLLQLRATGLSLDEIAVVTGRPKGSIKSSISAARKEFIKTLNKR